MLSCLYVPQSSYGQIKDRTESLSPCRVGFESNLFKLKLIEGQMPLTSAYKLSEKAKARKNETSKTNQLHVNIKHSIWLNEIQ